MEDFTVNRSKTQYLYEGGKETKFPVRDREYIEKIGRTDKDIEGCIKTGK